MITDAARVYEYIYIKNSLKDGEEGEMEKKEGGFCCYFCGKLRVAFLFSKIQLDWFMVRTLLTHNSRM